jgi:hypothetical protein
MAKASLMAKARLMVKASLIPKAVAKEASCRGQLHNQRHRALPEAISPRVWASSRLRAIAARLVKIGPLVGVRTLQRHRRQLLLLHHQHLALGINVALRTM